MRLAALASFVALAVTTATYAVNFNVSLDTQQEIPAPVLNGATPTGSATVTVNSMTGAVSVAGTYAGLTTNASAGHIHGLAPAGVTAGVMIPLTTQAAQSGSLTGGGTLDAAKLAGLLNGQAYLNIHTGMNGSGEIRGQIVDPDIKVFNVTLDSAQEVPAPNLGGSTPSGSARVVVDTVSGAIEVLGTYSGMTGSVTAAHLHGLAPVGTPTGVIFGMELAVDGTTFSGSSTLTSANMDGLLQGLTYLNVHTAGNPAGEIRGQVPEPSTFLLMVLACFGLISHRRRIA